MLIFKDLTYKHIHGIVVQGKIKAKTTKKLKKVKILIMKKTRVT